MQTIDNEFCGFVVRRYSDYMDMGKYAVILSDILGSLDEVFDELVEELKRQLAEAGDQSLSEKEWMSARSRIEEYAKNAKDGTWEFNPNEIEELTNATVPVSIKVNKVRLSDRLVKLINPAHPQRESQDTCRRPIGHVMFPIEGVTYHYELNLFRDPQFLKSVALKIIEKQYLEDRYANPAHPDYDPQYAQEMAEAYQERRDAARALQTVHLNDAENLVILPVFDGVEALDDESSV